MRRSDGSGAWTMALTALLAACDDGSVGGARDAGAEAVFEASGDADGDGGDVEIDVAAEASGEIGVADADGGPPDGEPDADVSASEATAEDAGGEASCDPATAGWDVAVVLVPAELQALLAVEDPILLNVFDGDIPEIPGTDAQIPFTDLDGIEDFAGHERCANLVLYCRRGIRSGEVGATLVTRGYRFVRVLEGGIEAWQAAGYPTEP